jgi:hypothetical protein
MVFPQRLDVLQLIKSLLFLDIVRACKRIGSGLLEAPLYRQVCLSVLRFDSVGAAIEVWAQEVECRSAHDVFVSQLSIAVVNRKRKEVVEVSDMCKEFVKSTARKRHSQRFYSYSSCK